MAELSPDTRNLSAIARNREGRRQKRLANLVQPQLQPDERTIAILTNVFERVSRRGASSRVAVVVTTWRVFVIRLGGMTGRVREIVASYPRNGVHVEWTRNAAAMRNQYGKAWFGSLKITDSSGTREYWVTEDWRQDHAEAVATTLEDGLET
jgi:hypothetical protein